MLGQPVAGQDERILLAVVVRVLRPLEQLARGVLLLPVERVAVGRLVWLVMRGHGPVDQPRRGEQPTEAIGVQDERRAAVERFDARRLSGRPVVRRLLGVTVGLVAERGPLLLLLVPPDVALALRPR